MSEILQQRRPVALIDGFVICFAALEDDVDAETHFVKECGWSEAQYAEIEHMPFFLAELTAWYAGEVVATEYLGTCCYESYNAFLEDVYYFDMRDTVVKAAKRVLKAKGVQL